MDAVLSFPHHVSLKLRLYVYRLVDPRTGTTFYVGRGQGNRVFDHAKGALKPRSDERDESLKLQTIHAILKAGLQVQHIIHRHGLTLDQAREVESAVHDAYPGLAAGVYPYAQERGAQHVHQIMTRYLARETQFHHRVVIVKVSNYRGDIDLLDQARYAWRLKIENARECKYVLAALDGLVIGVFEPEEWMPATPENFPGFPPADSRRIGFRGKEATDVWQMYVGTRLPAKISKSQAVARYAGPEASAKAEIADRSAASLTARSAQRRAA